MRKRQQNPAEIAAEAGPHEPTSGPRCEPRSERTAEGLWTITDAAAYLRVTTTSIYKMTAPKAVRTIPHVRIGRQLRFRPTDIDRWLSLLTISDISRLELMQKKVSKVIHGHNSQENARQR